MILEELAKRDIVVWGTGKKAEYLMNQICLYKELLDYLYADLLKIEAFLDSNKNKSEKIFHNRRIISPDVFEWNKNQFFCIIAVLNNIEIINIFEDKGYKANIHFVTYQNFLDILKKEVLKKLYFILSKMQENNLFTINMQIKDLFSKKTEDATIEDYKKNLFKMKLLYDLVSESKLKKRAKELLLNEIIAMLINDWEKSDKSKATFLEMRKIFGDAVIIAGLAFYYDCNIDSLIDFLSQKELLITNKKEIKTIGIYDERYHNGGGQRFLSIIMPIYLKMGYKVVFFTDEIKLEEEYELPENVTRIVLKKYKDNIIGRFKELLFYVQEYQVDVMCYHNKFTEIDFFYEMLLFKLHGIPVVAEIHLMFLQLMTIKNGLADKFHKIYRLADRIIVLSKMEEFFWKSLGCQSVYIPNPIEHGLEIMNKPLNDEYEANTILWIGRIDQNGKRILDIIDIMLYVVKFIPNAKLKVVGSTDNKLLLAKLEKQIKENCLEQNIEVCGYHTNVRAFYQNAAVSLMTSKMESFSMVIAESKLYGVPMVLYDLLYLELLRDGKGYVSVPQKDCKAAAKSIIMILQNKEIRQRLSREARESIKTFIEYDISGAWKKIFNDIASGNKVQDINYNFEFRCIENLLLNCIWEKAT